MKKHRKKVILIQPTGSNWIPGKSDITRNVNIMAPVGLCSMASVLENEGIDTIILDGYAQPMPEEKWVKKIVEENPDFLGISTTTSSFLDGIDLAASVKRVKPEIKIIFGGVHISALREKCLIDFPVIDYGVVGEGEESLKQIILRDGMDIENIQGVLYRGKNPSEVYFTGFRTDLANLDSLPFPAYDKLDGFPDKYKLPIFSYSAEPATSVITSRGCPYQCTYCDRSVFRRGFRYNSAEYIHAMLSWLNRRWGIKHVTFYDDIFTANRSRIESFCELMVRKPLKMTFYCAVRANQIDEDIVRMLKEAGCWQISFGVESGDPEIVKMHRKQTDLEEIKEKTFMIKKFGIRVKGLFILGLPGETEETIQRSIEYACTTPFDEINLSKFVPFPGAPIYNEIHKYGEFNEDWRLMNLLNFVFIPSGLTKNRLEELYNEFIKRFYRRPKILWNYSKLMLSSPCHIRAVLKGLPGFANYIWNLSHKTHNSLKGD